MHFQLAALPAELLQRVLGLVRQKQGGDSYDSGRTGRGTAAAVRSTCSWLRDAFDASNTSLQLGGATPNVDDEYIVPLHSAFSEVDGEWRCEPPGLRARLLRLVRSSPSVRSLTLQPHLVWLSLPEIMAAGGGGLRSRLKVLHLDGRNDVDDLSCLAGCTALEELYMARCNKVKVLTPLLTCVRLRRLGLEGRYIGDGVQDLGPLAALPVLAHLSLRGCNVSDVAMLSALSSLCHLDLNNNWKIRDISALSACRHLQHLDLGACETCELGDLSPLQHLTALKFLSLECCVEVVQLAPLAALAGLEYLNLERCSGLWDISPLSHLTSLRKLNTHCCVEVVDLAPLEPLVALQQLSLAYCARVSNLQPLARCRALERLSIKGCEGVSDLAPLCTLPKLRLLDIEGCPQLERNLLPATLLAAVELHDSMERDWWFWSKPL